MMLFNKGLNKRYLCADVHHLVDLETLLFYKYLHKARKFGSLTFPAHIFLSLKSKGQTIQVLSHLALNELTIKEIDFPFDLENNSVCFKKLNLDFKDVSPTPNFDVIKSKPKVVV